MSGIGTIRLASAGKMFRSCGFDLVQTWSVVEIDSLTKEQIEMLGRAVQYGKWIRIHPDDAQIVNALLGIADERPPAPEAQTSLPVNTKAAKADNKAAKAGKKEG